ncbi:translocation/assembly module TamB domain-containing protein [candidate division KSB1 bacterium]|nr:translocation/assembly module TamB domain-containing protein [candidate division KSB1 bacterium]
MKTRRWIVVIALFIGFSALVLYHGWNLSGADDKIKDYLLHKLRPVVGEKFDIESVQLSIGAVHLKGVKLSVKENYLTIKIENIRLGFNFINLIKNGFRPQKIPQDIIFVKPHLIFRAITKAGDTTPDSTSLHIETSKYLKKLEDFSFIKRITVSKGKISYIDSSLHEIIMGNDINGWLSARDLASATTRLVGKVFNSRNYNLSMTGNLDLINGRLDSMKIKLKNYEWNKKDSYFYPEYFDISRGVVDGTILLTERKIGKTGFNINGQFSISDGALKVVKKNLFFDNINLNAKIENWNCIVSNSSLLFNGSPVELSGKIINILDPKMDLMVESTGFDLAAFSEMIAPNTALNVIGLSSIRLNVSNTLKNPALVGELRSSNFVINEKKFRDTFAQISFIDSILDINSLNSKIEDINLTTSIKVDFSKEIPGIQFKANSNGEIFKNLIKTPFHSLNNSFSSMNIYGAGDLENFSGEINGQLETFFEPDTTFNFIGNYEYTQQKLGLNILSLSHIFDMNSQFDFSTNKINLVMDLNGIHNLFYDFSEANKAKNIFDFKESMLRINGAADNLKIDGDFLWNQENNEAERSAELSLVLDSEDNVRKIRGVLMIHSDNHRFFCNLDLLKYADVLEVNNFKIKDILTSNGRFFLNENKMIEANILFSDTPLADFARLIFRDSKSINQGRLNGSLNINGALKRPNLSCSLDISGLEMNNIGTYEGVTTFALNEKCFTLDQFTFKRNKELIFDLIGNYTLDSGDLNFDFETNDIDLNATLIAFFDKAGLLTGKGTGKVKLRGTSKLPRFYGDFSIEQGKLSRFHFDRLSLNFGNLDSEQGSPQTLEGNPHTEAGIWLKKLSFVRNGAYQILGQGFIPFSNEDLMDVELSGEGDIFAILPELTPFFKETDSKGNWNLKLKGSPGNIVVSDGEIEVTEGYMRLASVVPEIKNISMKAKLEQDGFLNVEYISGKVRRKGFVFSNVRSLANPATEKLQPFLIQGMGLDLGIFFLETTEKGIPINIPGFMEKKELGYYHFSGLNDKEKFYLAGPLDKPYVRGKLILQNVNFTYPFIKGKSQGKKSYPVVEVLRSVEWDVNAVTGKDLHYQRQIPSGLDNVYLDLIVDAGVGGLSFDGIINNKTFAVTGFVESSRGNVEYLNLDFQILKAGIEFDMDVTRDSDVETKNTLLPIIFGEARTTVTDSTGFPYYIYLTLLTTDPVTGYAQKRGRFGEVSFQLTSESSALGDSEGEILASLGYSPENLRGMATDLIGISADNLVFRPLFRPFERQLEQKLGLDMVRFSSRFTRNLIEMNVREEGNYLNDSKLFLLRSTKLMIGKYLADQVFLMYSGQLEAGMDYRYQHEGFGLSHKVGLEYRINPSLLLQMEYDYNSLMIMRREDKRVLLRHSFPF